ncbi:dehydrorhamnose reductase [Bathycoccus prasinos]|uniref:Dehydrorhamnose reductase n=1 Tax=Bathycoccus prasinos TaxID=41875 RepID=K8F7E9_9CHLO|nr:dehydrorhamnose reductase [Bathycoccus prasinos]CCO20765.1 dehydrorhamnose reductase [Bathycoccus prasinos]|eukprot:XP_007508046.1 dehydrorhamnose reductase [Bathycoccus prasinos]
MIPHDEHLKAARSEANESLAARSHPINVYGRSKAEGEKRLIEADPDALIIRGNWSFWADKFEKNFVYQLCKKSISSGSTFKYVVEQIGCPTYSRDLAEWTSKLYKL